MRSFVRSFVRDGRPGYVGMYVIVCGGGDSLVSKGISCALKGSNSEAVSGKGPVGFQGALFWERRSTSVDDAIDIDMRDYLEV